MFTSFVIMHECGFKDCLHFADIYFNYLNIPQPNHHSPSPTGTVVLKSVNTPVKMSNDCNITKCSKNKN